MANLLSQYLSDFDLGEKGAGELDLTKVAGASIDPLTRTARQTPNLSELMSTARASGSRLQSLAGRVPDTSRLVSEAESAGPQLRTLAERTPSFSELLSEARTSAPQLQTLAGRLPDLSGLKALTTGAIEESPSFKAAMKAYEAAVEPAVINQATLAGLGRSTALAGELARSKTAATLPIIQEEQARRERALQTLAGYEERGIGREYEAAQTGEQRIMDALRAVTAAQENAITRGTDVEQAARARLLNVLSEVSGMQERAIGRETAVAESADQRLMNALLAGAGFEESAIGRELGAGERGLERVLSTGLTETGRTFAAGEAEKTRQLQRELAEKQLQGILGLAAGQFGAASLPTILSLLGLGQQTSPLRGILESMGIFSPLAQPAGGALNTAQIAQIEQALGLPAGTLTRVLQGQAGGAAGQAGGGTAGGIAGTVGTATTAAKALRNALSGGNEVATLTQALVKAGMTPADANNLIQAIQAEDALALQDIGQFNPETFSPFVQEPTQLFPSTISEQTLLPGVDYSWEEDLADLGRYLSDFSNAPAAEVAGATAGAAGGLTDLAPGLQESFGQWYQRYADAVGLSPNPDPFLHQYDYRAWFEAMRENPQLYGPRIDPIDGLPHAPSAFKLPDHPTRFIDGLDTITGSAPIVAPTDIDLIGSAPGTLNEAMGALEAAPATTPGLMETLSQAAGGGNVSRLSDVLNVPQPTPPMVSEIAEIGGAPSLESLASPYGTEADLVSAGIIPEVATTTPGLIETLSQLVSGLTSPLAGAPALSIGGYNLLGPMTSPLGLLSLVPGIAGLFGAFKGPNRSQTFNRSVELGIRPAAEKYLGEGGLTSNLGDGGVGNLYQALDSGVGEGGLSPAEAKLVKSYLGVWEPAAKEAGAQMGTGGDADRAAAAILTSIFSKSMLPDKAAAFLASLGASAETTGRAWSSAVPIYNQNQDSLNKAWDAYSTFMWNPMPRQAEFQDALADSSPNSLEIARRVGPETLGQWGYEIVEDPDNPRGGYLRPLNYQEGSE